MILLKDALAQARRERGLTQEELAARLYIILGVQGHGQCVRTQIPVGLTMGRLAA